MSSNSFIISIVLCFVFVSSKSQDRSSKDLSFLVGDWSMLMTYNPEGESRKLSGTMKCQWTLDSTFVKCHYVMYRPGREDALNDVYFNYNSVTGNYESLWFSSTWPVKVLLSGDLIIEDSLISMVTHAEFPIGNGITEYVRDELVMTTGAKMFGRKTFIKTSNDSDWKHHSTETAQRFTVAEYANDDQIWTKTWQALSQKLGEAIRSQNDIDILQELTGTGELDKTILQKFLISGLNYRQPHLDPRTTVFRYPHYNRDSILVDFNQMEESKWISYMTDSTFMVTKSGETLLRRYWDLRVKQAENFEKIPPEYLKTFLEVLEKIVGEASLFRNYNHSIKVRISSRPSNFNGLPEVIRISELLKEYTAFINDVSHYKHDHYLAETTNAKWQNLKLSPLAKELMSATRNGRNYEINRCYEQPNWRVSRDQCDQAVSELLTNNLVVQENMSIRQTGPGGELSKSVERYADELRYQAWRSLNLEEYKKFVVGIEWVLANL